MKNLEYITVKELKFDIDGFPYQLKAKILKPKSRKDMLYYGKISHYCKLSEQAESVYIPSGLFTSNSISEVEEGLRNYANSFTSIGVETNNKFDS